MSIQKNLANLFMPHFESRRSTGTLNVINAELVHELNGDQSAVILINGTGTLNATYNVQGSVDEVNYFDLACYPYSTAAVGGTIPLAGQPIHTEAVNVATVIRMLCASVQGLKLIRVRLTAYASGTCAVFINSDDTFLLLTFLLNILFNY